jgi:hypothetical protein
VLNHFVGATVWAAVGRQVTPRVAVFENEPTSRTPFGDELRDNYPVTVSVPMGADRRVLIAGA